MVEPTRAPMRRQKADGPVDSLSEERTDYIGGPQAALALRQTSKTYGSGARAVHALEEITLDIRSGDFVSVLGPSGCGKTTLLKIVGDIISPSTGSVLIDGRPSSEMRKARRIGYAFQDPVLLPWRDVRANVALPFEIAEGRRRLRRLPVDTHRRIGAVLETVGLTAFADRLPRELSGGMQSRVALARALVYEPSVLLMDEPFAALDELTRMAMAVHLLDVWERVQTTVLFVTHHIHEAVLLSNRILVMSDRPGRVRRDITVDLPRPRSVATRRLPLFHEITEDLVSDFYAQDEGGREKG
jgi:NitT/TauT family transport system ATP-binding protein